MVKKFKYTTTGGAINARTTISFDDDTFKKMLSQAVANRLGKNISDHMKLAAKASLSRPSDIRGYNTPSGGKLINSIGHRLLTETGRRASQGDVVKIVQVGAGIATKDEDYYTYVEEGTGGKRAREYGGPQRGSKYNGVYHDRGRYVPKFTIIRDDKGAYHSIADIGTKGPLFNRLMAPIVRTSGPRWMQENYGSNWSKERIKKLKGHLKGMRNRRFRNNLKKNAMFLEFASHVTSKQIDSMSDTQLSQLLYQFVAIASKHGFAPNKNSPNGQDGAGLCESNTSHNCSLATDYAIHHWTPRANYRNVNGSNFTANLGVICSSSHPTEENVSRTRNAGNKTYVRDYKKWIEEFTSMRYGGGLGRTSASNFDKEYAARVRDLFKNVKDPSSISSKFTGMKIGLGKRRHKIKGSRPSGSDADLLGNWPGTVARKFAFNTMIAVKRDPERFLGGKKLL